MRNQYSNLSVRLNERDHQSLIEKIEDLKQKGEKPQHIMEEALVRYFNEKPKKADDKQQSMFDFDLGMLKSIITQAVKDAVEFIQPSYQMRPSANVSIGDFSEIDQYTKNLAMSSSRSMTAGKAKSDQDDW